MLNKTKTMMKTETYKIVEKNINEVSSEDLKSFKTKNDVIYVWMSDDKSSYEVTSDKNYFNSIFDNSKKGKKDLIDFIVETY